MMEGSRVPQQNQSPRKQSPKLKDVAKTASAESKPVRGAVFQQALNVDHQGLSSAKTTQKEAYTTFAMKNQAIIGVEGQELSGIKMNRDSKASSPDVLGHLEVERPNFTRTLVHSKNSRHLFSKQASDAKGKGPTSKQSELSGSKGRVSSDHLGRQPSSGSQHRRPAAVTSPLSTSKYHQHGPIQDGDLLQGRALANSGSSNVGVKKQSSVLVPLRANNSKQKLVKIGAVFSQNTTKECTFCQPSLPMLTNAHQSSWLLNSNSSITRVRALAPRELIMSNLGRKYSNCQADFENMKVVNDLIYNEQTHIVCIFKDYLILDDINEFLKRPYALETESQVRLPKLCDFYQKYSRVFPNFVPLPEAKYMFRNIQRKQRLIDDQYALQIKSTKDGGGPSDNTKVKEQRATLLDSANRLFTTGFIESVWNQKSFSVRPEEDWTEWRREAQEKKYLESARRLDKANRDKFENSLFQPENLDLLVQKFLHKDTESTIRLNSSLGQVGDDILGETFQRDLSQRFSLATNDQECSKAEIGVVHRKSVLVVDRASVISANTEQCNIQTSSVVLEVTKGGEAGFKSVTGKVANIASLKAVCKAKQTVLKQKSGTACSAASVQRLSRQKSVQQYQQAMVKTAMTTAAQLPASLKQKVTIAIANNAQNQLGSKYLSRVNQQSHTSTPSQLTIQRGSSSLMHKHVKSLPTEENRANEADDQKLLRDNYLECEILQEGEALKSRQRQSVVSQAESRSQSPIEDGIQNPLSAQPLLSKTSLNQKTTQPGSSLEFFKQRTSEHCVGSATPTQHLYHSKQTSFKKTLPNAKVLPHLNQIQQQVDSDYYRSGTRPNPYGAQLPIRAHTEINQCEKTDYLSQPGNAIDGVSTRVQKQMSRDPSPPLMQKREKKTSVKHPHQKKDKRTAPRTLDLLNTGSSQYLTGKSSVSSDKNLRVPSASEFPLQQQSSGAKTSLGTATQAVLMSLAVLEAGRPMSTLGSQGASPKRINVPKLAIQNDQIAEDFSDEEVADEIPDGDDTEDEQEHMVSDDEGHVNESATTSMRDRLRPVEMLLTHAGAFQEEDSQGLVAGERARAKTQLALQPFIQLPTASQRQSSQQSHYPVLTQTSIEKSKPPSTSAASIVHYGSQVLQQQKKPAHGALPTRGFNTAQQPDSAATHNIGLDHIHVHAVQPLVGSQTTSHAASLVINRPKALIKREQAQSVHNSKFSRENSTSSRQETHPGRQQSHLPQTRQISLHESQRIFDAGLKLGSKPMTSSLLTPSQTLCLRQSSLETGLRNQPFAVGLDGGSQQKALNCVSGKSSEDHQSNSKAKNSASGSLPRNQKHQMYFKMDLTSRMTANLGSDQLGKKKGQLQKSGTKPIPSGKQVGQFWAKQVSSSSFAAKPNVATGDRVPKPRQSSRQGTSNLMIGAIQSGMSSQSSKGNAAAKSQSPQAPLTQTGSKASHEKLGFKVMGSGKASYLTNVGAAAPLTSTLTHSSRNMTSPYATANQRLIPKDASSGSFYTRPTSRSPKDSFVFQSLKKGVDSVNLQQKLHEINRQLAIQQVKTGSFREKNTISPSQVSSSSQSKKVTSLITPVTAVSPQPSCFISSIEKAKQLKALSYECLKDLTTKSLQRQNLKQFTASQALISLPATGKASQKSFAQQLSRVGGAPKQLIKQQMVATADQRTVVSKSFKTGHFLGQKRQGDVKRPTMSPLPIDKNPTVSPPSKTATKTTGNTPQNPLSNPAANQKMAIKLKKSVNGIEMRASERSLKSVRAHKGSEQQINFLQGNHVNLKEKKSGSSEALSPKELELIRQTHLRQKLTRQSKK